MIIPDSCLKWLKLQRSGYTDPVHQFNEDMDWEFRIIRKHLPVKCNSILDIGCGIGGIDVLLSKHYHDPALFLLDRARPSAKPIYGFDRGESFYNDFGSTVDLMVVNNIFNYQLIDIENGFPEMEKVDMVISLLSWGYHYPVEKYIKEVDNILQEGGIIIMDIRENTNGIDILNQAGFYTHVIIENNKAFKIIARRLS
jgi:SAM-dependent methyltransferase